MTSIGYWVPADGPTSQTTLVYILANRAAKRPRPTGASSARIPNGRRPPLRLRSMEDPGRVAGVGVSQRDRLFADQVITEGLRPSDSAWLTSAFATATARPRRSAYGAKAGAAARSLYCRWLVGNDPTLASPRRRAGAHAGSRGAAAVDDGADTSEPAARRASALRSSPRSYQLSEADGFFRSDNLVSNELFMQRVIPDLTRRRQTRRRVSRRRSRANFTYMPRVEPAMAFIVDIRRGNLQLHLMYKALFELSAIARTSSRACSR